MTTKTPFGRFPPQMALPRICHAHRHFQCLRDDEEGIASALALEEIVVTGTKRDVAQQD